MTEHYHEYGCGHTIFALPDKPTYGFNRVPDEMPEIEGLFIGGCVQRGVGSSFRRQAHAHNHPDDETYGWVCVRSPKRVLTPSGKPSALMYHEYAHILTPKQGHTIKWAKTLANLGHPAEARRCCKPFREKGVLRIGRTGTASARSAA